MDAVIGAVITPIADAILKPLVRELGYLFKSGGNLTKLKKISEELNQKKDKVREDLERAKAESDELVPTEQVTEWMTKVQTLENDEIAKINEDYDRQKACVSINCWRRYRISKRAAKAVLEAEELLVKHQQFEGRMTVRSAPAIRRMPTLPEVTPSSTEMYLSKAIDYIQDNEVGMVGIWGMGGVGKTTLLRKINNHPSVANAGFNYVIWLVASQDLNLDRLQKEIADRVGFKPGDSGIQAQALHRYLEMKNFLLLLDDIWEHFDLTTVGIPYPRPGDGVIKKRKVVFTTRSESVCRQMTARSEHHSVKCEKIKIECLQQEEAWELFLSNVGEDMRSSIKSDQRVSRRAKTVAKKCGGLPLALVVIARTMSASTTWREWEEAVNLLNTNKIQEMWDKGDDPFPLLKISYDRLLDDVTRKCFLCCALWPEDHRIPVPELIDCWLGMNLLNYCGDIGATYSRGYKIVAHLKRACLLERVDDLVEDTVKMHDIIRGMAIWIVSSSKEKWMVSNRANLKDELEDATQWREADVISLSHDRSGILPHHPDCPKLSCLILSHNGIYDIPEGFFQNMMVLTFLDLSSSEIKNVPPAIGGLLQLRHLNLSNNPIKSLPVELENLGELKVLLLNDLPCLVFPKLSKLHKLVHLGVLYHSDFSREYFDKEDRALMQELVRSKIASLDVHLTRFEALEQLAKNPSASLRHLRLTGLDGVTSLPLQLLTRIGKTCSTLSTLHIWFSRELEDIWISKPCKEEFEELEYFALQGLPALRKITSSGSLLRNVRFIRIRWCGKLKSATWILQCCQHLESLSIEECDKMEHVIGSGEDESVGDDDEEEVHEEGEAAAAAPSGIRTMEQQGNPMVLFPNLRHLELFCLPKLRAFSTAGTRGIEFPSLKEVQIDECPLLDEAPFAHLKITRPFGGPPQ